MTADALFMQFWRFFLCVYKTTSFSYAKDHSIVLKREEKGLLKFTTLFSNKRFMLDVMRSSKTLHNFPYFLNNENMSTVSYALWSTLSLGNGRVAN